MKIALIGDSLTEGRPGVSFFNILKEKFPNITFINLGKPGETVKSLHTRLLKTKLDIDYDLTFLWIGVNDRSEERRVGKECRSWGGTAQVTETRRGVEERRVVQIEERNM